MTDHEVKVLLKAIRSNPGERIIEKQFLYLMLATGRRLDQIIGALNVNRFSQFYNEGDAYVYHKSGKLYWLFRPKVSAHPIARSHENLINRKHNPVVFELPSSREYLGAKFSIPSDTKQLQSRLEEFVRQVNKNNKTRITINRVADFLAYYLRRKGVDDVMSALITGNIDLQEAGIYYQQYDNLKLVAIYDRYYKDVFDEGISKQFTESEELSALRYGGSQIILRDGTVTALFEHLIYQFHASKEIHEMHNAFTFYVLHLLNLATGHRPVKDPYDDLNKIDLLSRKICITDKESRHGVSSTRILVLPEIAVQQIRHYLEHLRNLLIRLKTLGSRLSEPVGETLDGKNRLLFFLIPDSHGDFVMQSISPKTIQARFSGP